MKRGDAAGKTSARPGNPEGSTDFEKENGEPLGQEIRGQTRDSTDKVKHDVPSPRADASQSSHSKANLDTANVRKGRRGIQGEAACGPRKRDAGRGQPFPPNDRRSDFCRTNEQMEALASYANDCQMWPPLLGCKYPQPDHWTREARKKYNSKHGITPGTLYTGVIPCLELYFFRASLVQWSG